MSSSPMSTSTHFWLRIAGLSLILAAQFGPRLWSQASVAAPRIAVAAASR